MSSKKKPAVNQHIVPQAYLKRFATLTENGNYQIGIGIRKKDASGFFITTQSIKNVGYLKNFYEVPLRETNYWENYFATVVEPYCGTPLSDLIERIKSAEDFSVVLTQEDKCNLTSLICPQILRSPQAIEHAIEIGQNLIEPIKEFSRQRIKELTPSLFHSILLDSIDRIQFTDNDVKDIALQTMSDNKKQQKRTLALLNKTWFVYENTTQLHFMTSDTPVCRRNPITNSFEFEDNKLDSQTSILLLPLTPTILIQIVPNQYIGELHERYNGRKFLLGQKDLPFISVANISQMVQCYRQIFMSLETLSHFNELAKESFSENKQS